MFILPLMAILLGIESYLVFSRSTNTYQKNLIDDYSMLVVAKKPLELKIFKNLNNHIYSSKEIERESIVSDVAKGINKDDTKEILDELPYFYNLKLDSYLNSSQLDSIKQDLKSNANIKRVETFGSSYKSNYRLFMFIKFILNVFIIFMATISIFLIIKQMEIWKYAHKERMRVMEIFGAPLMLRSGILFKVAFFDAIASTILVSSIFFYLKFYWAVSSGIDMIRKNQDTLFRMTDIGILLVSSLIIVIISVYTVVFLNHGADE